MHRLAIPAPRSSTPLPRQLLSLLLAVCLSALSAAASASQALREANFAAHFEQNTVPLTRKNQALLNYLWVDVYAAAFYAPAGVSAQQAVDDARHQRLQLYYFRAIKRQDVIKAAWHSLERQHRPEQLEPLRSEVDRLHASFRDIAPGDRYALDFNPQRGLNLERNGQIIFTSRNPDLAKAYLGIWLAPNGLSESLRSRLLAD